MSEYDEQAERFLSKWGISFGWKARDPEPFVGEEQGELHDTYLVTFRRGAKRVSFRFHQSLTSAGTPPTPYDVLAAITKHDPGSFGDFASEYGYDLDSRKAEKVYRAVVKEWRKVEDFFGSDGTMMDELREIS